MKTILPTNTESFIKDIVSQKEAFRQHQRNLPFSEKMQIAFALAERDKTISRAVLLPKKTKDEKSK